MRESVEKAHFSTVMLGHSCLGIGAGLVIPPHPFSNLHDSSTLIFVIAQLIGVRKTARTHLAKFVNFAINFFD
jgi:hypothetical protein